MKPFDVQVSKLVRRIFEQEERTAFKGLRRLKLFKTEKLRLMLGA